MNKHKLKFIVPVIFLILTSCSNDNDNIVNLNNASQLNSYNESLIWDEQTLINDFWNLTSSWNLKELSKSIKEDDFEETQKITQRILDSNVKKDLTSEDRKKIQAIKYVQIWAILNEWNYNYKEEEKSKEAFWILQDMVLTDPDYVDPFYSNYYLWYSQEVIKNYTWALNYYQKALDSAPDIEKNKITRSIILTQIWHVYDLSWNIQKAYLYYKEAYDLNNNNFKSSFNIWRYLTRVGRFKEAKQFFKYSLLTPSKKLKSEIYYSLSSIELELNGLKPDIDKSLEYAKKSIENNKIYPMWYLALARWYYMLDDKKYYDEIEKNLKASIKLNPNWNEAYKYYWLFYLDSLDLEKALEYIDKSKNVIDNDMILMKDQKNALKYLNDILKIYMWITVNNMDDIYDMYDDENFKPFILFQLKRKNYWIYKDISKNNEFKKVINYYN